MMFSNYVYVLIWWYCNMGKWKVDLEYYYMYGIIDILNMKIYLEILLLVCKKLDCFCWEKYGS